MDIYVRIMHTRAGDKCILVTPETIEQEIKPLMRRGYVLSAKPVGATQETEKVLLHRPEDINVSLHQELYMRPAITAG